PAGAVVVLFVAALPAAGAVVLVVVVSGHGKPSRFDVEYRSASAADLWQPHYDRRDTSATHHTRGSRRSSRNSVPVAAASIRSSCSPNGNVVISSNNSRCPTSTVPL